MKSTKGTLMLRQLLTVGFLAGAFAPAALPADGTAKDHYFESGRNADAEWTGVRTSVMLRRGKNATAQEVGEGYDFRSGDQFRIRLQANDNGFAYLVFQDAKGYKLLYPAKDAKARSNQMRAFEERLVPSRAKEWLTFDNKPAIEGLYLIYSPKAVPELEKIRTGSGMLSKSEFDELMAENGKSTSMIFDEVEDEESGELPSTYYVEKVATGRTFLVRRMDLVHRSAPRKEGER